MARFWKNWFRATPHSLEDVRKEVSALAEKAPIPLLWLFGKTGSGKTSIVRYLTGADDAIIGEGYRPQTKCSRRYDFPTTEEPLLSFLDTRGLGEAVYDPTKDIESFSNTTQLVLVVVRVNDHALVPVIEPLKQIRQSNPERTILLILTCLHQVGLPSQLTSENDPFEKDTIRDHLSDKERQAIPENLRLLIDSKIKQFEGLYDVLVPIDLTHPEDGFIDPDFGGDRLKNCIVTALPNAYRQSLIALDSGLKSDHSSERQRRARWQVLASSSLAATAGALPLPWLDIPAVLAIQTHMAYKIAEIYEQEISAANWAVLTGAVSGRVAVQIALRELWKFIPFVGVAAGAATSFAFTYALGMSWDWYFANVRKGRVPSTAQLQEVFKQQLQQGRKLWGLQR
jgi:uncharacterized protein (DUF697 family)/predicted GTPase